jgi:hypothetical protein
VNNRRFPPPWSIEDIGACLLFVIDCVDVKTLCRLVCNSFDALAVWGRLTRFSSSHKFNLVVPAWRRPMSRGVAAAANVAKLPGLLHGP